MTPRNPTEWMWAQALEVFDEAERMHRQFFRLVASERTSAQWEPPANVFEDDREVIVVVALPGVPADAIEVTHEPGALLIRAQSALPFAAACLAVRRLEIPYGRFERRIPLPQVRLEPVASELANGCLVLRLAKTR